MYHRIYREFVEPASRTFVCYCGNNSRSLRDSVVDKLMFKEKKKKKLLKLRKEIALKC